MENDPVVMNIEFGASEDGSKVVTMNYMEPREQSDSANIGRTLTFKADMSLHIEDSVEEINDSLVRLLDDVIQQINRPPKSIPSRKGRTSLDQ